VKCDCTRRLEAKHQRPQRTSSDGRQPSRAPDTLAGHPHRGGTIEGTTLTPRAQKSQEETHADQVLLRPSPLSGGSYSQTLDLQLHLQVLCPKQHRDRVAAARNLSPSSPRSGYTDSSSNPSRPALLGRRRSLRTLHDWNTRERRCILVAGQLDVEIWNTELEITGTATSLSEQQAISDEAFGPQPPGAHP
jgi:hypothetical protein